MKLLGASLLAAATMLAACGQTTTVVDEPATAEVEAAAPSESEASEPASDSAAAPAPEAPPAGDVRSYPR